MISSNRTAISYLRSLLFIPTFISILIGFDICMRFVTPFSHRGFLKLQYWMCKTIRLALYCIGGVQFKIEFPQNYPTSVPLLVVSNHQSMYDVSLLTELFDQHQPRFISKKELAKWVPGVSFIARNNKTALIDRKNRSHALAEIAKVARLTALENAALVIFPEGTRARDGQMKQFKKAGMLSILSEMPRALIVPVAISGSWKILQYGLFPIPTGIEVGVKCLSPIEWNSTNNLEATEKLLEKVEQMIGSEMKDFL